MTGYFSFSKIPTTYCAKARWACSAGEGDEKRRAFICELGEITIAAVALLGESS